MSRRLLKIRRKKLADSGRLKALGVFIFAGLFTEGVKRHFDVMAHLEDGPFGVLTARHNNPGMPVFDDPAKWPQKESTGPIDFIFCNPPCAPWSPAAAGRDLQWQDDPRVACWHTAFAMLKRFRPTVWASESVRGAFVKGRPLMDHLAAQARELGYKATFLYVDAQNHNLPQQRRRFFMIFHKVRLTWKPPHGEEFTVREVLESEVSELGWFKPLKERSAELARNTKPGKGIRGTWDRLNRRRLKKAMMLRDNWAPGKEKGTVKGRPGFLTTVLNPDAKCGVLLGNNRIHWNRERMISINEGKAICGLRQDFEFHGPQGSHFSQLTKAVLPNVGEYLAKMIRRSIERDRPNRNIKPIFVEVKNESIEKKKLEIEE